MKEKLKKFFTNKAVWEYLIGFICLLFVLTFTYSKGFVDGVLIGNEIRTEIIESGIDELKKDKIEPKKAIDYSFFSPLDTIGEFTKVYLYVNEDIASYFYYNITDIEFEKVYNIYSDDNESIYLNLTFYDEQSGPERFFIDLEINGTFLAFEFGQNRVSNLSFSDNLPIDDAMSYDELLNYTGSYINDNRDLLRLNDYYFNNTDNSYSYIVNEDFTRIYAHTYDIQIPSSFLSEFLGGASTFVSQFALVLVNAVTVLGTLFYANGELTIVGSAMALALGVGAIYLLFRMIRGLIKNNNRG